MVLQNVCRLCLASNIRTLDLASSPLQEVYEKLTSTPLHNGERPIVACYLCHSQLRRTYNLMVKSLRAEKLLTEICLNSLELKRESIISINREAHQLTDVRTRFTIVPQVIMGPELIRKEQKIKDEPITEDAASVDIDNEPLTEVVDIKLEVDIEHIKTEDVEDIEFEPSGGSEVNNEESEDSDIKPEASIDIEDGPLVPTTFNDSEDIEDTIPVMKCEPTQGAISEQPQVNSVQKQYENIIGKQRLSGDISIIIVKKTTKPASDEFSESGDVLNPECTLIGRSLAHSTVKTNTYRNNEDKLHECPFCKRRFGQKFTLNNHLRTHTGEKPFKCGICEHSFRQIGNLNVHLKTHTGEKPYKCDTCETRFAHKDTLNNHLKIHTGEKPFKCTTCQRGFSQKSALNRHLKTHTGEKPFVCGTCHKAFNQKNNLNYHLKIHTGDKPFTCGICQHSFSRKLTLNNHLKIHTGEKPYKCDFCEHRSRCKNDLTRHIKTHRRQIPLLLGVPISNKID